jgi:hypothetical protein
MSWWTRLAEYVGPWEEWKLFAKELHGRVLARPRGETKYFVECARCIVKPGSPTLCWDCLRRRNEQSETGWTSLPDWWKAGTPVRLRAFAPDEVITEIVCIRGDVAELWGLHPGAACWHVTKLRPVEKN